ncbi:MAG: sodium:calcium antiporter [Acidimicrobiia bacterium]
MLGSIALVGVGLVLLVIASDRLVVSAVRVARTLGVSTVLIGAVLVGLGTSIPELLVSGIAASAEELDVAMSNVVGSNVANVTLVLGTAALVAPVAATSRLVRREGLLMLFAVVAFAGVLADDRVARTEAIGLLAGLVVALTLLVFWSRSPASSMLGGDEPATEAPRLFVDLLVGVGALIVTVVAANVLLDGALDIGERLEWSDTFLGLLLGVGTSLPELATALAAARRRESGLVVGNVIGSNIFNSLAVAGTAGVVGPAVLTDLQGGPVVVMILTALAAGILSRTGIGIGRIEGGMLLAAFAVFGFLAF